MIDDPEYRALLQRLDRLERETPRVRQGTVTAGTPLAVSLGASPTSFDDVRALHGATVDDGAQVAALTFGNDMLVLGGVGPGLGIPLVTSLPSPAFDGQVVDYQSAAMAALGIVWRFRYRSAATGSYKWEFVGGPPLWDNNNTNTAVASTTYSATNAPAVTVPLAGDFMVEYGGRLYVENPAGNSVLLGLHRGGSLVQAIDSYQGSAGSAITLFAAQQQRTVRVNGGAASAVYDVRVAALAGGITANAGDRWLSVTPVRVG